MVSIFSHIHLDLVNEVTTFGRKADCDISKWIDKNKLTDVSNIHFTIRKKNEENSLSPVFLEVNDSFDYYD